MSRWLKPQKDSLFLELNGQRLHYKRAGHGPVLLLLHGSASSLHHFEACASLLAAWFDVVRPDLAGFGLTSPRGDRDYRVSTYASDVAAFMEALGVPSYAVAGNSFGGNVAWNLALEQPACVRALILINATGYPEKSLPLGIRLARHPLIRPILRRWLPRALVERSLRSAVGRTSRLLADPVVLERAWALMNGPGRRSAFIDFVNTEQPDRSARIREIATPTLVLRSASVDGQHFTRDLPNARELVHESAGHLLPEEDATWIAQGIAQFLNEVAL